MERFKYFDNYEFNMPVSLADRFYEIIKEITGKQNYNLLDILEYYNVLKLLNILLKNTYTEIHRGFSREYLIHVKTLLHKTISVYFSQKTKNELLMSICYVFSTKQKEDIDNKDSVNFDHEESWIYREDFLECYEKYHFDKKIEESELKKVIEKENIPLSLFLKKKYFCETYPNLMKKLFLCNPHNFELFLDNYSENKRVFFVPDNITKNELYNLCENYILSRDAELTYIKLIEQGLRSNEKFDVDAKLKLHAKKKREELEQKIFFNKDGKPTSNVISQMIIVHVDKNKFEKDETRFKNLVDISWIRESNEPESLLNFLMYLGFFFNQNWILNLCSFPNHERSTLIRMLTRVNTQKNYEVSFEFSNKNVLLNKTFRVFQKKLEQELNIRIEDLLTFFFTEYSKNNFQVEWLTLEFASSDQKKGIQTKNLCTVEEQIRKQWKLLVEENKIDQELFELENTPRIQDLGSFLPNKYIYENEDNESIKQICHLLFSDQSGLNYTKGYQDNQNFMHALLTNKINITYFNEHQLTRVYFLANYHIITIDEDGYIFLTKKQSNRIKIFSSLFYFGVIHYYRFIDSKIYDCKQLKRQQQEIDEMVAEGLLIARSSLFSKPETDYLDYMLNNSKFDNACGLRNKYLHGSTIDESYEDYFYMLIILIIFVIKINEELVIKEDNNI